MEVFSQTHVVGNFFRLFTMGNLRDFLEKKYFVKIDNNYPIEKIAGDVLNLLNADQENYFDVTGFAKDFYLSSSLTKDGKNFFYQQLKSKGFFKQLNTFLYSDNFSICSWTIYIIGKFSIGENANILETAYETNFRITNPILSYRCLNELSWLISKKLDKYLADLELDNSKTSKLISLYYWETSADNSKFNELLADKQVLNFIAPNQTLVDTEAKICDRLFAFENHITELYNSTIGNYIDRHKFEKIAEDYFATYIKTIDEEADREHQEFLKHFGEN